MKQLFKHHEELRERLLANISKDGDDQTIYYYRHAGGIFTDILLDQGKFINSRGNPVSPKRTTTGDLLSLINKAVNKPSQETLF